MINMTTCHFWRNNFQFTGSIAGALLAALLITPLCAQTTATVTGTVTDQHKFAIVTRRLKWSQKRLARFEPR